MCSTSNTFAARRLRAAGAYPPLTRLEVRETRLKHRHTHVVTSGASSAPVSLHVRLLSVLKICGRHKTLTLSRADVEPLKKKKSLFSTVTCQNIDHVLCGDAALTAQWEVIRGSERCSEPTFCFSLCNDAASWWNAGRTLVRLKACFHHEPWGQVACVGSQYEKEPEVMKYNKSVYYLV